MEKTVFRRQKQMKAASEHCSVPLCSVSSRYNSCASFHSFPVKKEIRKKWIVNIRRINFQVTKHTKVCSVHFKPDDFVEGTSRRRLKKGAVPSVFEWNRERQMQPSTPDCSLDDGAGRHLGRGDTCRSTHPQFHWFIRQILLV